MTEWCGLQLGDVIHCPLPPWPDGRNWWQRRMPWWLGGRDKPGPVNFVVTAVFTSQNATDD